MSAPSRLEKLKTAVRVSTLIAVLFFAAAAYPDKLSYKCGDIEQILGSAFKSGFIPVGIGASIGGSAVEVFVNLKSGDWIIYGIDNELNACQLLRGKDWAFIGIRTG